MTKCASAHSRMEHLSLPTFQFRLNGTYMARWSRSPSVARQCPSSVSPRPMARIRNIGDIQINPGHRLGGKVVLSDGKSIADGMRVSISADRAWDTQTVLLKRDGSFELIGLASGKYQVFASVRGYQTPQWDYRMKTDPPGTVQLEHDINDFLLTLDPINKGTLSRLAYTGSQIS